MTPQAQAPAAPAAPSPPSRRSILGALATASAATALSATPAFGAEGFGGSRNMPGTAAPPVSRAIDLHMMNRFAYGFTPALAAQMKAAGGARAWFAKQLSPAAIPDEKTEAFESWWPALTLDYAAIWQRDQAEIESGWTAMANYARWRLLRRIYSQRQVQEIMTEFWENFLYVPVHDDGVFPHRIPYGKLLQEHSLGRFEDMLVQAITHPAMGIALDNARSNKKGINENLGRELLELYTVGQGHYTEADVKDSAKILTGYRVDTWSTFAPSYDTTWHYVGPVQVMGFSHANGSADGRPVAEAYLRYLASHPKTAQRIARKLALRFVSDEPSQALVDRLASVYLANDTAIKPVLLALIGSTEFRQAAGKKVRTPTDDVVATWRVLGAKMSKPTEDSSAANAILWQAESVGQRPFSWPRPDGPPDRAQAWTTASRLLASFDHHYGMSGGWWPKIDNTFRSYSAWVPKSGMRFDAVVAHLSRELLGREPSAVLLKACVQATGIPAGEKITDTHALVRYKMPRLLTTILDTPAHMSR